MMQDYIFIIMQPTLLERCLKVACERIAFYKCNPAPKANSTERGFIYIEAMCGAVKRARAISREVGACEIR